MPNQESMIIRRAARGRLFSANLLSASLRPVEAQALGPILIFYMAPEEVKLKLNRRALPAIVGTEREDNFIPDVICVGRTALISKLVVAEFSDSNTLHVDCADKEAVYLIDNNLALHKLDRGLQLYIHREELAALQDGVEFTQKVRRVS